MSFLFLERFIGSDAIGKEVSGRFKIEEMLQGIALEEASGLFKEEGMRRGSTAATLEKVSHSLEEQGVLREVIGSDAIGEELLGRFKIEEMLQGIALEEASGLFKEEGMRRGFTAVAREKVSDLLKEQGALRETIRKQIGGIPAWDKSSKKYLSQKA